MAQNPKNASDWAHCLIKIYEAGQLTEQNWRVLRRELRTPDHLLKYLSPQDRKRAREITWLVAAPLKNSLVAPTGDYLELQVFYATEVPSPVPLLLHGEFPVNTERTAIIADHPFNDWVAAELASLVVEFVKGCYQPKAPATFLRVLRPYEHLTAHDFTQKLWHDIKRAAREHLRLPDLEGVPRLRCQEALVPPASELAHELLRHTDLRPRLVHQEVNQDKEVVKEVLEPLEVEVWNSENILLLLQEKGREFGMDREWLWLAWQWLAEWVGKTSRWSDDRKKRVERVRALPLLPVAGTLTSAAELEDRFITWKDEETPELPDWLPLAFLDTWFADRIKEVIRERENQLMVLLGLSGSGDPNLGISKPDSELWRQALEKAIDDFWKKPGGTEKRFLEFILASGWHEEFEATDKLKRCPVPVLRGGKREFEEAGKAYFSSSWGGGELLEQLWDDDPSIPWAQPFSEREREKQMKLYRWLGVNSFPKLSDEEDINSKRKNIKIKHIEFIDLLSLNVEKGKIFILFLIRNWAAYYKKNIMTYAYHRPSRCRYDYPAQVDDYWWFQVKNALRVPVTYPKFADTPLSQCWLPDVQAQKILGQFLPIIDLGAFPEEHRQEVVEWLRYEVRLRERLDQLKLEEWQGILQSLPERYPTEQCRKDYGVRNAVGVIYRTFLESSHDPADLREVVWLSRKEEEWDYRESCWLDDDEDVAQAFCQDIWLMLHLGTGLEGRAARLPRVRRLSRHSNIEVLAGGIIETDTKKISLKLQEVIPFVYVWLRDQGKLEEKGKEKLRTLTVRVVDSLKLKVSLEEMGERTISKNWALDNNFIFLSEETLHHKTWWSDVSQGLARLLQRKADQEFYEILFRCENEEERRAKLRRKEVREENIEKFLEEYHGAAPPPPDHASEPRSSGTSSSPTLERRTPVEKIGAGPSEEVAVKPAPIHGIPPQVSLINPNKISGCHPIESTETLTTERGINSGSSSCSSNGISSLFQEERWKIEKVSRQVCRKKLEDEDYVVEEMPEDHPSFDLKASKDGRTKLIEVKGHVGSAAKVEISTRQLEAYLKPEIHGGNTWKLWNVEHLGENGRPPQIQIFTTLDLDQVEAKSFYVDIRKQRPAEVWKGRIADQLENLLIIMED